MNNYENEKSIRKKVAKNFSNLPQVTRLLRPSAMPQTYDYMKRKIFVFQDFVYPKIESIEKIFVPKD